MADSFLFLSGQISVLETKLLQSAQLDRMIGSHTPEEAFGVLSELSYAQYFDEDLKASDFMKVLSRGLKETKNFLDENVKNPRNRMLLWLSYDLNNIKRAAKDRFLFGAASLSDFTEDNGYVELGNLTLEALQSLVYDLEEVEMVPSEIYTALVDFAESDDTTAIQKLDNALDRAYLQAFYRLSLKTGEGIHDYARAQIDACNIRGLARNIVTIKAQYDWLEGGMVESSVFDGATNMETFVEALKATDFRTVAYQIDFKQSEEDQLNQLESGIDHLLSQQLSDMAQSSDGLLKVLYYAHKRWVDARIIKAIMFGKFYGLEATVIDKKVKALNN